MMFSNRIQRSPTRATKRRQGPLKKTIIQREIRIQKILSKLSRYGAAPAKKNGQAQVVHTHYKAYNSGVGACPPNLLATRRSGLPRLRAALHTRLEYRGLRFLRRSCACKTKNLPPSSLVAFRSPGAPASLRHEQ